MKTFIVSALVIVGAIGFGPLLDGQKRLHGGPILLKSPVETDARRCTTAEKSNCGCGRTGRQVVGCTVRTIDGTMTQTCVCGYYNDYTSR